MIFGALTSESFDRAAHLLSLALISVWVAVGGLTASEKVATDCALVQVIDTSLFTPPSPDPSGLTLLPDSLTFLVVDAEVEETDLFVGVNLFEVSLTGNLVSTGSTERYSDEPTGVALNPANGHVFVSDDNTNKIFEIAPGTDATIGTADDIVTSVDTTLVDSGDPEDVAFDAARGHIVYVDGRDERVFRVTPGANGIFDGVAPEGDDEVSFFETVDLGISDPEGLTIDPETGHLLMVGLPPTLVVETTSSGTLIRTLDISQAGAIKPSGLAIAPGSVNPDFPSLYITDRGIDNSSDRMENDGKIYEFTLALTPTNFAPSVDAGPDLTVALRELPLLNGTATDDGVPKSPSRLNSTWSQVSGPGTVTFRRRHALRTTASFSSPGEYVLQLTASDGALEGSDECRIIMALYF